MTIGFLLNTCEPFYRGGYERRAWSFARELVRQGHDVRIYTSCERDETIEGVRFVRLARPRKFFNDHGVRNGGADLLFAFATLRLLFKLRREEIDVLDVCATPFLHLPFLALIGRLKHLPLVLTCHEALLAALPDYVRERGNTGPGAYVTTKLLALLYRCGMMLFPQRLAVSHRTALALKTEGYPALNVIEFGLESDAFRSSPPEPRPPGNPVRLIYCGRLTPIKSVDQVLAALLPLPGETGPFQFDVVGDGSERARLERMVGGEPDVVTFHGEVSETRKRELLAAADVFVLGSPREGFSIATLEAMAQGCAALVVSDPSRPNGVLDFVRDREEGLAVSPALEAMREGLRRLIANGPERESFRHRAWETARRYQIQTQARLIVQAYRALR